METTPAFVMVTSPVKFTAVATLLTLPTNIFPFVKLAPAPSIVLKVALPLASIDNTWLGVLLCVLGKVTVPAVMLPLVFTLVTLVLPNWTVLLAVAEAP